MAASKEYRKALASGRKGISASLHLIGKEIAKVVSSLRTKKTRYILKLPLSKRIGKVFYTVRSTIEPVTFTKKKDAECFKELLNKSTGNYQPEIIRREVVDEGYNVE